MILSPTFIADMFPENQRGRVMGIFYLAIPVGTAMGYVLGGLMGPAYGWRTPFLVERLRERSWRCVCCSCSEPPVGQFEPIEKTPDRDTLKGLVEKSCVSDRDLRHGHDDVRARRIAGVDADVFASRAWLHAGAGE